MAHSRTFLLNPNRTVTTSAAGGGTTNTVTKFTGAYTIGDSSITDNGSVISSTVTHRFADGTAAAPSVSFINATANGIFYPGGGVDAFDLGTAAVARLRVQNEGLTIRSDGRIAFTSGAVSGTADTILIRDAADVLAMKNGATAQEFRVYGTTTGTKYLTLQHNGSSAIIGAAADDAVYIRSNAADRWFFDNLAGNYKFAPNSDNTVDIGGSSNRVRTGYFGTALAVGTNPATTGGIRISNANGFTGRNAANTADIEIIRLAGDNSVSIGSNATGTAAGSVYVNLDQVDQDFIVRSDTNANHFVSDAGAFTGAGAFGFGTVVSASAFIHIIKPAGATTVFEFVADNTDPTGGGGAATGRIPITIGGATRYLAYY